MESNVYLFWQSARLFDLKDLAEYDPSQDIIFPPELLVSNIMYSQCIPNANIKVHSNSARPDHYDWRSIIANRPESSKLTFIVKK